MYGPKLSWKIHNRILSKAASVSFLVLCVRRQSVNIDSGTARIEFPRSPEAVVTLVPDADLVTRVLPNIGAPFRTAEESAIFDEVASQLASELQ